MDTTGWKVELNEGWRFSAEPQFKWVPARHTLRVDFKLVREEDPSVLVLRLVDPEGNLIRTDKHLIPEGEDLEGTWDVNLEDREAA